MKFPTLLLAGAILTAGAFACKPLGSITARPDPVASTSGTIGSVKATDGVLPIGDRTTPLQPDTMLAKH